jgi:hypothetical protein
MLNGIAFGMVVAPVSFGLLQMTYIPVIGKFLGLVGLVANLIHGSVGYLCLLGSGMLELNSAISGSQMFMINIVNGILFSYVYGIIGHSIDGKLHTGERKVATMVTA